ncbi:uncharacterized protein KZ484_024843 isoform 2-T2 [Pholidichthys leucotaenia]
MADAPEQKPSPPATPGKNPRSAAKTMNDLIRGKTRVNIGESFSRWRELLGKIGLASDAELAAFLLDCADSAKGLDKVKAASIQVSDTAHGNQITPKISKMDGNEATVPLETTSVTSEEEEMTDEDGSEDDSEDEDSTPPLGDLADFPDDIRSIYKKKKKTIIKQLPEMANNKVQGESPKFTNSHSGNQQLCRPKKVHNCPTCGKEFPRSCALKRHLVVHSGERPFKCFICGRGFTQSGNLKTHMKVHKGEMHKWTLVQEKNQPKEPSTAFHVCGECGMDFPEKHLLEEHYERHKKPYSCPECGKTFKHEKYVEIHMLIHSEDCPFICSVCEKRCISAETLASHMLTHTRVKNFHCGGCGKAFAQSTQLDLHRRTHTGERPYLCSVCGKSFARRDNLTNHLRVHSGEKPYCCYICGKCFSFSASYRVHLKTHDKKPRVSTRPLGRPKQQQVDAENL